MANYDFTREGHRRWQRNQAKREQRKRSQPWGRRAYCTSCDRETIHKVLSVEYEQQRNVNARCTVWDCGTETYYEWIRPSESQVKVKAKSSPSLWYKAHCDVCDAKREYKLLPPPQRSKAPETHECSRCKTRVVEPTS